MINMSALGKFLAITPSAIITTVDTVADLRNTVVHSQMVVELKGYYAAGDGGGGTFLPGTTGPYTDNGGTIITPNGGVDTTAWLRVFDGEIDVLWFGADPTGTVDSRAAFQAAVDTLSAAGGGLVVFSGEFLIEGVPGADGVNNGILFPFTTSGGTANRVTLKGAGRSSVLKAGSNNMYIIRYSDNNGGCGNMSISGNGFTGVYGLGVVPEDPADPLALVSQNFNIFQNMFIFDCEEGIILQCGLRVGTADSGCFYNSFADMHILNCTRAIWLKDTLGVGSGSNRNLFYQIRIGFTGGALLPPNTGLQIDDGGTNVFIALTGEGILNGVSPNATPTFIKIVQTGGSGADNNGNRFLGATSEACTISIDNDNLYTEFYGCETGVFNMTLTQLPLVLLGSPVYVPQILPGYVFQNNGQIPSIGNLALHLPYGRIEFPSTPNPTTDVQTLDQYLEGTFTPTFISTDISAITYTDQLGRYVKIGRHVFIWLELEINSITLSGAAADVTIGGLPFASSSSTSSALSVNIFNFTAAGAGVTGIGAVVPATASPAVIQLSSLTAASSSPLQSTRLQANTAITATGCYVAGS